jgi:hypothetical protein
METEDAPTEETKRVPRCRCGHDRNHPLVSPSAQYTFTGWFLTMVGISARPTSIKFICRRCDQVVDTTTDPTLIAETKLWG